MRRALETLAVAAFGASALLSLAPPALAGSAWDEIRPGVFGTRTIHPAGDLVALSAPARPTDQRAVPIAVEATFKDGRTVRAVTLIVDDPPSPPSSTSAASATT